MNALKTEQKYFPDMSNTFYNIWWWRHFFLPLAG